MKCLYLTQIKPSRKNAQRFAAWLEANHPTCSFTEFNVTGQPKSYPIRNGGRYQGQVDGPEGWAETVHATERQAVYDAARSMLAS